MNKGLLHSSVIEAGDMNDKSLSNRITGLQVTKVKLNITRSGILKHPEQYCVVGLVLV